MLAKLEPTALTPVAPEALSPTAQLVQNGKHASNLLGDPPNVG